MLRRVLSERGAVFCVSPSQVCNLRTRLSANLDGFIFLFLNKNAHEYLDSKPKMIVFAKK